MHFLEYFIASTTLLCDSPRLKRLQRLLRRQRWQIEQESLCGGLLAADWAATTSWGWRDTLEILVSTALRKHFLVRLLEEDLGVGGLSDRLIRWRWRDEVCCEAIHVLQNGGVRHRWAENCCVNLEGLIVLWWTRPWLFLFWYHYS